MSKVKPKVKPLDIDGFLRKLRALPKKFKRLKKGSMLHFVRGGVKFCPITAVAYHETGMYYRPSKYRDAAKRIHLAKRFAYKIVNAADYQLWLTSNPQLRKRIARAMGLVA